MHLPTPAQPTPNSAAAGTTSSSCLSGARGPWGSSQRSPSSAPHAPPRVRQPGAASACPAGVHGCFCHAVAESGRDVSSLAAYIGPPCHPLPAVNVTYLAVPTFEAAQQASAAVKHEWPVCPAGSPFPATTCCAPVPEPPCLGTPHTLHALPQVFVCAKRVLGEVLSAFEFLDRESLEVTLAHLPGAINPLPECQVGVMLWWEAAGRQGCPQLPFTTAASVWGLAR